MTRPTTNYVAFSTVFKKGGNYYHQRPWLYNALAERIPFRLFCEVIEVDNFDRNRHTEMSPEIEVVGLFQDTSFRQLIWNRRAYLTKLFGHTDPQEDVYLLPQTADKREMAVAVWLRQHNCCLWVKSEFPAAFGSFVEPPGLRRILSAVKPLVKFTYPKFFEWYARDSLVLYSGDIVYMRDEHTHQYAMKSLSRLNRDSSRISRELTGEIVFVGDDSRLKGLDILLNVLVQLDASIELTVIGTEELSGVPSAISNQVTCVGEIFDEDAFFDTLAGNDILVLPSRYDKQPKVTIEAMSAGVVPVCADVGGVYTLVQNLYNGMLFEPENSGQLANCLRFLYDNPEVYQQLLENGLETAGKHSIEDQADLIVDTITHYYGGADGRAVYH